MPDGPEPLDNSIDITLSMLDGQHMDEFMKELTTVRDNFKSMTEDLSRLADSFEKVAETAGKAGEYASRPEKIDGGERPDGGSSAEDIERERPRTAASASTTPPPETGDTSGAASEPIAPGSDSDPTVYKPSSLSDLGARTRRRLHVQGMGPAALGLGAEGWRLLRGGTSTGESVPDDADFVLGGPESLRPDSSFDSPSIIDRIRSSKAAIGGAVRGGYSDYVGSAPSPEEAPDPNVGFKRFSEGLQIWQAVTQHHLTSMLRQQGAGEGNREYSGSSFGYDQTGGDVAIPGTDIGFRMPFGNPASRVMLKEDFEKMKYRAQPGLNKDQVDQIFNAGYQQGFTPQTEQSTDVFRTAMADMMKKNTSMAEDPTYQGMLGEAVKYGAIALKDFNANMQQIPIIAAKANVGLGDFMQGVGELSQQITGMGGNPFQAADWATQFTARTGLAPSDMSTLAKSPFFATEAYQKTGLLPFEQGLMSGAQATQVATQSVFDLAKMPGLHFGNIKVKSPDGGSGTISGASQQAAMIASITGLPEQKVANMLKNRKRIESENAMEMDARQMLSQLRKAHGNKGKISATMDPNNVNAHDNITTMGDLKKRMADAGFSKDEQNAVMHAGKKKHSFLGVDALAKDSNQDPVTAMEGRIKKMQQIEAEHASKGRGKGGKTTEIKISFTGAAEKLLKVAGGNTPLSPANVIKDMSNAGDALPNAAFGIAKSALTSLDPVTGVAHLLHINLPGPF